MDLGALFGQAEQTVSQQVNDLVNTGGNALIGFAEAQGVQILQGDQAKREQVVQAKAVQVMNDPSPTNPFSKYLQGVLSKPVVQKYGPWAVAGIAAVAIGAVILFGRK